MFHYYKTVDIQSFIKKRANETKLGECIIVDEKSLATPAKFVLLGIKEDIGIKANFGIGGANTAWESFLSAFLNIQSTDKLVGSEIQLLGCFNFKTENIATIDAAVSTLLEDIVKAGKIPLIIGGGHNNAYPNIKGTAKGLYAKGKIEKEQINAINLDAHSDFRIKEGRHSGNGFRYAYEEGFLKKYAIVGLHENYNAQNIITEMTNNPDIHFCYWEDIFLREKISFQNAVNQSVIFSNNNFTGIELDLDCIENTLSSALTPCGITTTQARQYLYQTACTCKIAYLHICEGATELENGLRDYTTGKLISYLVSDFLKAIF